MRIRPGEEPDVATAAEIVERAYEVYVEGVGGRPAPMDADYSEAVRAGTLFVAEDGAGIAGLIVLASTAAISRSNVAVDPRRQGEGVGRALLAFAEEEARSRGVGSCASSPTS